MKKGIKERISKTNSVRKFSGIKNDNKQAKMPKKEKPRIMDKEKESVLIPVNIFAKAPQPANETNKQGMRKNSINIKV